MTRQQINLKCLSPQELDILRKLSFRMDNFQSVLKNKDLLKDGYIHKFNFWDALRYLFPNACDASVNSVWNIISPNRDEEKVPA